MKKMIPLLLLQLPLLALAQVKVLDHAVITTKTTTISPENAEENTPPPPPPGGDGEQRTFFRFGGDGETKSTTTLKGDLIKTYTETEMSRSTVIRDNNKKMTTTMMEIMGKKTAFYVTDSDQVQLSKRMDSMMQSRRQNNDNSGLRNNNAVVGSTISYFDDTKKFAGIVCKKALLITNRQNGNKDTSIVWYCPDFKLQGIVSTGGFGGGGFGGNFGRMTTLTGLNELNGFPMYYEMNMGRGRKMIVEVTKINIDKEVADKEFEIPKDVVVKSMKEMQNGNGGFQIRMGGPGQ